MRIKRGVISHKRHKKLLHQVKGYRMTKHRLVKVAREAAQHAGQYAYAGRRIRKSTMRRLWITRINAGVKLSGLSYSRFIHALKQNHIDLNRKSLAHLAVNEPATFSKLVELAKTAV